MAEHGSWPSIVSQGLLSTTALLDLYEVAGTSRTQVESEWRRSNTTISKSGFSDAVIRDQIPMPPERLERVLQGISPQEWYELLNSKVFFWTTQDRLVRLLRAKQYRNRKHTVLKVDTKALVESYAEYINLCHMNSGNTLPYLHKRDRGIFVPISTYSRRSAPVELTVEYAVPDISTYVISAEEWDGGSLVSTIWSR